MPGPMLDEGDRAPDFTLPDQDGTEVSLSALLAQGPVVLYFYPADFTPGCTAQACMVRDAHEELAEAGVRVVGISPQGVGSKQKFAAAHRLPFPVLADPEKRAIGAYGVSGPLGLLTRRATFLVRPDGVIAKRVVADLNIGKHKEVLALARAAGGQS